MKKLAGYFLRGLILLLPIGLTIFLVWWAITWVDQFINVGIPGIGLLIVLAGITIVGIVFSGFIGKYIFGLLDEIMSRTPLVKIIYTSLKDLIDAFVGEKKKFSEPVLVTISATGAQAFGFVTNRDLKQLGLGGKVAVYFPYSYALTGHLLIIPVEHIQPVEASATEVMRFVISGGVTGFSE